MTRKARLNYIRAVSNTINRKKMYKAKKQWVVASMSLLVATGLSAVGNTLTHVSANSNRIRTNRVMHPNKVHKKHVVKRHKLNKKQRIGLRNKRTRAKKNRIKARVSHIRRQRRNQVKSHANRLHKAIINNSIHNKKHNIKKIHSANGRKATKRISHNHKVTIRAKNSQIRRPRVHISKPSIRRRVNNKHVILGAYRLKARNNNAKRQIEKGLKQHKLVKG